MSLTLYIPKSFVRSLRIPEVEAQERLRQELAVALYAQELLSFGKAAELAVESRFHFANTLTQRGISRHYGEAELKDDSGTPTVSNSSSSLNLP
jgi:predicted HTH domain antitoxin